MPKLLLKFKMNGLTVTSNANLCHKRGGSHKTGFLITSESEPSKDVMLSNKDALEYFRSSF